MKNFIKISGKKLISQNDKNGQKLEKCFFEKIKPGESIKAKIKTKEQFLKEFDYTIGNYGQMVFHIENRVIAFRNGIDHLPFGKMVTLERLEILSIFTDDGISLGGYLLEEIFF